MGNDGVQRGGYPAITQKADAEVIRIMGHGGGGPETIQRAQAEDIRYKKHR